MCTMEMSSPGLVSADTCQVSTVGELLNIVMVNWELLYNPCSNLLGLFVFLFQCFLGSQDLIQVIHINVVQR